MRPPGKTPTATWSAGAGILCLLIVLFPPAAIAQVIGPLMEQGDLEAGFAWHWIDRKTDNGETSKQFVQDWGVVAFRYGVTASAVFALELAAGHGYFDSGKNLIYSVGASLQTGIWSHRDLRITTTLSYARMMYYGAAEPDLKNKEQVVDWRLAGEYPLRLGDQSLVVWAGPSISELYVQDSPAWYSVKLLGAAFGARCVLFERMILQGDFNWVNDFQSNLLLAYRF